MITTVTKEGNGYRLVIKAITFSKFRFFFSDGFSEVSILLSPEELIELRKPINQPTIPEVTFQISNPIVP